MFSKFLFLFLCPKANHESEIEQKSCYKDEQTTFSKRKNVLHHFHSPIKKKLEFETFKKFFLVLHWRQQKFKNLLMKRINQPGNFRSNLWRR